MSLGGARLAEAPRDRTEPRFQSSALPLQRQRWLMSSSATVRVKSSASSSSGPISTP
jgi:hypothetical protein